MLLEGITPFIILIFLLLLSAFFSAAETAFSAANLIRIRSLVDDNVKGANRAYEIIQNPQKMISAILVCNNIVNITITSFISYLAITYLGGVGVAISTVVTTILILIIGEITPKAMALIYWEPMVLRSSGIISFITKLLSPIIFVFDGIRNGFLYILPMDVNKKSVAITEAELRTVVDFSHEEGVIESEERRMINNVVDFGDSLAKDVMVPRIDMSFVSIDLSYHELVEAFSKDKYTRMPVYSKSRNNIVGIVNLKDVFFYKDDVKRFNILKVIREAYFTYEYKKTSELLIEMRNESISIAIVLDEYGATAGLITLEDLLEEIVGEIRDEYDGDEGDLIMRISENEYLVDGFAKLDEINEELDLKLESNDYDSIAGHIIYLLGHLPTLKEKVSEGTTTFIVENIEKNRIDKVRIFLEEEDGNKEGQI